MCIRLKQYNKNILIIVRSKNRKKCTKSVLQKSYQQLFKSIQGSAEIQDVLKLLIFNLIYTDAMLMKI